MHQPREWEQHKQCHPQYQMHTIDECHPIKMCRGSAVERHHGLRPAHQFHHFAAIHMLRGEGNRQQPQRTLHHQQGHDQHDPAHQAHHAARAAANHRHFLFHFDGQEGFVHPVRCQHPQEVPGEDAEDPQMEQVRPNHHPFAVQHLTGTCPPAVLAVVITQPASYQKHRPGNVRVHIKEEHIQEVHYCCPPVVIFRYCGATAPAKRRW